MTVLSLASPGAAIALPGGMGSLPLSIAPFISLFITQLIVRRASFSGHLAGIVAGYIVGWGALDGLRGFWIVVLLGVALGSAALTLRLARQEGVPRWLARCIAVSPEGLAALARAGVGAGGGGGGGEAEPGARR
jgi:hypothetical protein